VHLAKMKTCPNAMARGPMQPHRLHRPKAGPDAQYEGKQNLSDAGEDVVLNINMCINFVIPLIFTDIQRVKIRLFNKSNGRLVHVWESHWKRPMGWDSTHLYFP